MPLARASVLVATAWLALFGAWLPASPPGSAEQLASTRDSAEQLAGGRVLAVIGRQVGFLNFEAPRPRILTAFGAPSFAIDVTAVPSSTVAVMSVAEPFGTQGDLGGDLLALDLGAADAAPFPLVARADPGEWLGAPAWLPDGSSLLFQREDLRAGSDLYAGQAGVRYHSRIEMVPSTGGGRAVLIGDGHHPSPSADGTEVAFVRLSARGTMLIAHDLGSGEERTLVAAGTLADIAYPRYSPSSDRIAFVATSASSEATPNAIWLAPGIVLAHGLPWNLWVVQRDGSGLRQLAAVGADDASVAWSPDGSQLFVYGSTGARLVDAASGATDLLTYLAGFGAISWLP